jgi:hypothetical protein
MIVCVTGSISIDTGGNRLAVLTAEVAPEILTNACSMGVGGDGSMHSQKWPCHKEKSPATVRGLYIGSMPEKQIPHKRRERVRDDKLRRKSKASGPKGGPFEAQDEPELQGSDERKIPACSRQASLLLG